MTHWEQKLRPDCCVMSSPKSNSIMAFIAKEGECLMTPPESTKQEHYVYRHYSLQTNLLLLAPFISYKSNRLHHFCYISFKRPVLLLCIIKYYNIPK